MPSRTEMESIRESIDIQLPIQIHTRPSTPVERDEIYNMQVLSLGFGKTEDDLDHHFLITALNLGLTIPQHPTTTLELIADNVSARTVSSDPSDPFSAITRTSESTQPTSCSSSQQQLSPTKASSQTTASFPSAPASIVSSSNNTRASSMVKIRKGLRRLSTFTRRKTGDSVLPPIVTATSAIEVLTFEHRPATAGAVRTTINRMQPATATQTTVSLPEPPRPRRPRPKTIVEETESEDIRHARARSERNARLQRLRVHQLEEQGRFLRFEDEQSRLVQSKKTESRRSIMSRFQTKQQSLWERHAEVMADLELRHLTAELDLTRALQSERKACETRLRHMDAYCNSRTDGMPRRKVTEDDYRKLVQQHHIRSGMDRLHESRINVLREKQAKQLERIQAKQEAELKAATEEMNMELKKHDSQFHGEEIDLQQDFWDRKKRILARWALAEAIERRKLEYETGQHFAPLPPISWSDERSQEPAPALKRQSMPPGQLDFYRTAVIRPHVHRGITAT